MTPTDKPAPDVRESADRIRRYIEAYEDAPSWGGPTIYPSAPSLSDLRAILAALRGPTLIVGVDPLENEGDGGPHEARLLSQRRPSAEAGEVDGGFKQAVIDALVVAHIYRIEHENDPRKALNDLLAWEQSIPVGMVLVPREPTEEMFEAARSVHIDDQFRVTWQAMIAAAPGAAK